MSDRNNTFDECWKDDFIAKYGEKDTIEQVVFGMILELSSSAVMERPVRRSSVISFKKRLAKLGVKL